MNPPERRREIWIKTNLTLIGMPGAGKSTIGIILAKNLGFGFVDTDVLIQISQQKTLQRIIDENGHLGLRAFEEREIIRLNVDRHVIATGGRAVYSERAMNHLGAISTIIFLEVDYETIKNRIRNFETRGIAKAKDQTFRELFEERRVLYEKYAEITVNCNELDQETVARRIEDSLIRLR